MARDNIKFVGNGVTVYIGTIEVKFNFTNGVKVLPLPTQNTTPNETGIINLNKVEKRFTITGSINNGKLGTETYTTALNKKNALITMFGLGSTITMNWEGEDIDVSIDKYEVSYKSHDDKDDEQDGISVYDVVISCVEGGDLV